MLPVEIRRRQIAAQHSLIRDSCGAVILRRIKFRMAKWPGRGVQRLPQGAAGQQSKSPVS